MPKTPDQPPVSLRKTGDGDFTMITGWNVPMPPEGCESQQMMDWGSTVAIVTAAHLDHTAKLRMIQTYCERWDVGTDGDFKFPS